MRHRLVGRSVPRRSWMICSVRGLILVFVVALLLTTPLPTRSNAQSATSLPADGAPAQPRSLRVQAVRYPPQPSLALDLALTPSPSRWARLPPSP